MRVAFSEEGKAVFIDGEPPRVPPLQTLVGSRLSPQKREDQREGRSQPPTPLVTIYNVQKSSSAEAPNFRFVQPRSKVERATFDFQLRNCLHFTHASDISSNGTMKELGFFCASSISVSTLYFAILCFYNNPPHIAKDKT